MSDKLLFRFRKTDTPLGVCRATLSSAAQRLGISETQVIHNALARYIAELPGAGQAGVTAQSQSEAAQA